MTIEFYTKQVYGATKLYIADEDQAQIIKQLTGRITITTEDIEALQKLGVRFKQVMQSDILAQII